MQSIFNSKDNAEFIGRIDKLSPTSQALWGKMNASQMLAHCQVLVNIALGELKQKREFFGLLFGKIAKKKILNDAPLPKNLPTLKQAIIKDDRNFEDEKAALKMLVARFRKEGHKGLMKDPHPFFGPLTIEEWDKLQVKHLDHHLRQFGV
jgi:hypothetical protein